MLKRGFTILELVAVLVIIGILSGLGAVAYSSLISKSDQEVSEATVTAFAREAAAVLAIDDNGDAQTAEEIAVALVDNAVEYAAITEDAAPGVGDAVVAFDGEEFTLAVVDGAVSATQN